MSTATEQLGKEFRSHVGHRESCVESCCVSEDASRPFSQRNGPRATLAYTGPHMHSTHVGGEEAPQPGSTALQARERLTGYVFQTPRRNPCFVRGRGRLRLSHTSNSAVVRMIETLV